MEAFQRRAMGWSGCPLRAAGEASAELLSMGKWGLVWLRQLRTMAFVWDRHFSKSIAFQMSAVVIRDGCVILSGVSG